MLGERLDTLTAYLTGEEGDLPQETEAERTFRSRNGPFLNAIDQAGGTVSREEFGALGRRYGFDPRGLGGFATGRQPSIRSEADRRVLTPRGKREAERWRRMFGNSASMET